MDRALSTFLFLTVESGILEFLFVYFKYLSISIRKVCWFLINKCKMFYLFLCKFMHSFFIMHNAFALVKIFNFYFVYIN